MKKGFLIILFCGLFLFIGTAIHAQKPIVIGVPTSLGFLEGKESYKAVQLAVEEINSAGGVKLQGKMRPFKVEALDIRDAAPGVPVPEALLGLEKIILEKRPAAIVVGPFRSEALLAGMDIIAKYRVPMLGTIAMTPLSEKKIKENPEKYRYIFRVSLNVIYWAKLLAGTMEKLRKEFGFNKVYLMNQDVLWARGTANAMKKRYFLKTGWEVLGHDQFPTGFSDFSSSLMKAKAKGAEVLFTCFDMPQSGVLVKQWKSMKVPALIAGFISPMAGQAAWNTFEKKIGGILNAVFEIGNIPCERYEPSKRFYEAYLKKFGQGIQSGHGPAPSYEAVYILKDAIEKANSLDPDSLVSAIEATDRIGVMGRIRFDKGHQVIYGKDPKEAALNCFFQWTEDGKRRVIYPDSIAEGKIFLPSWVKGKK